MERKILFKGKRLDGKGWAIGDLLHSYENGVIIVPIEGGGAFSVDPSTVCQFTGLKDKYGKDVWEHDILEDTDTNTTGEVTFGCGVFAIDCLPVSEYIYDGAFDLKVLYSKFDRKEGEK